MKNVRNNAVWQVGAFLISLGIMMLVARLDLLQLGEVASYFRWQILLILFGVWSLLSLELVSAVVLFAIGIWFLLPDMSLELARPFRQIYWPSVLVLAGIAVILSAPLKKLKKQNPDNYPKHQQNEQ